MTDSEFPSVSILSLASLADLSARMGHDLSIHRWRGNLWVDGLEPWAEWGWIGQHHPHRRSGTEDRGTDHALPGDVGRSADRA